MKTFLLLGLLLFGVIPPLHAQSGTSDPAALAILDRMADQIGALHSCSFHLSAAQDVPDADVGTVVKRHNAHDVYMMGPDKMLVASTGEGGRRRYWYDGKSVTCYSFDENNYARISAPPTIVGAIDSLHRGYGIDFPAADFIYPTFVDDLIAQSRKVVYQGTVNVGGKECFHIVATGPDQDVQLWIANEALMLPVKYIVRDKSGAQAQEFEGTFDHWDINPDLPSEMFGFVPPPGAREVRMLSRNEGRKGGRP